MSIARKLEDEFFRRRKLKEDASPSGPLVRGDTRMGAGGLETTCCPQGGGRFDDQGNAGANKGGGGLNTPPLPQTVLDLNQPPRTLVVLGSQCLVEWTRTRRYNTNTI